MEYGITMFVTDYSIPAIELAVAVEERRGVERQLHGGRISSNRG